MALSRLAWAHAHETLLWAMPLLVGFADHRKRITLASRMDHNPRSVCYVSVEPGGDQGQARAQGGIRYPVYRPDV